MTSKVDWVKWLALLVALTALLFGNNLYQQVRHESVFETISKALTPGPTKTPMPPITMTVTNKSCHAADYYINGAKVISDLAVEASQSLRIPPGHYETCAVVAGQPKCGPSTTMQRDLTSSGSIVINPAPDCP